MNVIVTGGDGFIGKHLVNFLSVVKGMSVKSIGRTIFNDPEVLAIEMANCDVVVHLAAVNRHENEAFIYTENVRLSKQLTLACETANVLPHILFASSSQEFLENTYGKAKRNAREHIQKWTADKGGKSSGLIIPNVFGPFGRPDYNSFVATFCHKIARNQTPTIIQDKSVELIYVFDLVQNIYQEIIDPKYGMIEIQPTYIKNVSEILEILNQFKWEYQIRGIFPNLQDQFELSIFNTYRCYIPHEHYPVPFKLNTDQRGIFVEVARTCTSGQTSYSITHPGITRGNHFHTRKAERFAVIQGKAQIELRKIDSGEKISYIIDGDIQPAFVDMPIWYTHNITNIGNTDLLTIFWINEPYDANDPDTYFVNV